MDDSTMRQQQSADVSNADASADDTLNPTVITSESCCARVHMFVSPEIMPGDNAMQELDALSQIPSLEHPIAAMPDVHYKGRNPAPTGIVVAMRDQLFPHIVDKGINCGMRMVRTNIPATELTEERIDTLFTTLQERVPIKASKDGQLKKKEALNALLHGAEWACQRFELPDSERDYIERRGSMFEGMDVSIDDLRRAIPDPALKKARRSLGSLGAGNHFLEAQKIVEILDPAKAELLGLREGDVVFMMHTGSGAVAGQIMRYYSSHARPETVSERMAFNLEKLRFHLGATHGRSPADLERIWHMLFSHGRFFGLPADSEVGRNFTRAVYAASNFGYVNRMAITEALRGAVRDTIGESFEMPLLFDCSHVAIQNEDVGGENLWVHRHGANVALPPSKYPAHPVFSQTGQPIPVPGSMGADSYIGVGVEGNLSTYHSANHGAGRVLDKPEAGAKWSEEAIEAEMASRQVRLYRGNTMNIAEQAPDSFKDIGQVIRVMQQLNIAAPVVRVQPLATMKG